MRRPPSKSNPSVEELLRTVTPATPEGADLVLDLRELLLERGHPGRCVLCFFRLLGDLKQPGALAPLRHWIEQNLEIGVSHQGEIVETLPVSLHPNQNLEEFCQEAIATIRDDRCYEGAIELEFRYKELSAS